MEIINKGNHLTVEGMINLHSLANRMNSNRTNF